MICVFLGWSKMHDFTNWVKCVTRFCGQRRKFKLVRMCRGQKDFFQGKKTLIDDDVVQNQKRTSLCFFFFLRNANLSVCDAQLKYGPKLDGHNRRPLGPKWSRWVRKHITEILMHYAKKKKEILLRRLTAIIGCFQLLNSWYVLQLRSAVIPRPLKKNSTRSLDHSLP